MRIVVVGTLGAATVTLARTIAMHLRLPLIELDAINWHPVSRDLTRHDPVLFIARVSRTIYYGLHSTPTELPYDADGTHYKRSETYLWCPRSRQL